jgi:hypothetical protein
MFSFGFSSRFEETKSRGSVGQITEERSRGVLLKDFVRDGPTGDDAYGRDRWMDARRRILSNLCLAAYFLAIHVLRDFL